MNNFYYPYTMPYLSSSMPVTAAKTGLKGLLSSIKWGSIVDGTQKTLGIVNQAIPLVKQARPVINNAKTMFRVMNEFKKADSDNYTPIENETQNTKQSNGPTFFQ